jgi:predicted DNA-binding ribbon-helix-helix protein
MITTLREDSGSFTSFLRVCCLCYLLQLGREFAVSEHPALMPTVLPAAPSLLRH